MAGRNRGAAMIETVLTLPFIMVVVVLIIYLGWNFRRLAQVTNMDRYAVWEQTTPGSPGPDIQRMELDMRNPRLNNAFFGLNGDDAERLDELSSNTAYTPQGHEELRDSQADEAYSYFDAFLEDNPRAIRERFTAEHEHITDILEQMGMDDTTRNATGHSRMNGEWRYVNGVRFNESKNKWEPGVRRVSPGSALRDVFFVELDDGLEPYDNQGNNLAGAIREFAFAYPAYRGPDVDNSANGNNNSDDTGTPGAGSSGF